MITKALKGFDRSVQQIGILPDGSLFLDAHVFDDDYGDYADTDYVAPADVTRLKGVLCGLGLNARTDADLLDVLAELFDTAHDAAAALKALGVNPVHRVDLGARCDVLGQMPEAA
jgi:hypothetical protein